jgi:hypothetical protein
LEFLVDGSVLSSSEIGVEVGERLLTCLLNISTYSEGRDVHDDHLEPELGLVALISSFRPFSN